MDGPQESEQTALSGIEGGTGLGTAATEKSNLLIKQKGAVSFLEKSLALKEGNLPPEISFDWKNVPGTFNTNETVPDENFFKLIREVDPRGSIVAVGFGNAFSLFECFREDVTPKSVILADIDSRIVATGKTMIQFFEKCNTFADFEKFFLKMSQADFFNNLQKVIKAQSPEFRRRLEQISEDNWEIIRQDFANSALSKDNELIKGKRLQPIVAVRRNYEKLHNLAKTGNIGIFYTDFLSTDFIEAVRKLPDFRQSRNIIYASNIIDHITNRWNLAKPGDYDNWVYPESGNALNVLQQYSGSDYIPIYIDTSQAFGYNLRAGMRVSEVIPAFGSVKAIASYLQNIPSYTDSALLVNMSTNGEWDSFSRQWEKAT